MTYGHKHEGGNQKIVHHDCKIPQDSRRAEVGVRRKFLFGMRLFLDQLHVAYSTNDRVDPQCGEVSGDTMNNCKFYGKTDLDEARFCQCSRL